MKKKKTMGYDDFGYATCEPGYSHYRNNFLYHDAHFLCHLHTSFAKHLLKKKVKLLVQRTSVGLLPAQILHHTQLNFSAMIPSFSFQRWRKSTPIVVRRFPFIFWRNFLSTSLKHCLLAANFWALSWRISQKSRNPQRFRRNLSDRWGIFSALFFNCFSLNYSLMDVVSN